MKYQELIRNAVNEIIQKLQAEGNDVGRVEINFPKSVFVDEVEYAPWMQSAQYVKTFTNNIINHCVAAGVGHSAFFVLTVLLDRLQYQTNNLTFDNGVLMNRDDICRYVNRRTGLKQDATIKALQELKKTQMIAVNKTGRNVSYKVNPCLYFKGTHISKNLYNDFKSYIDKCCPTYIPNFQVLKYK